MFLDFGSFGSFDANLSSTEVVVGRKGLVAENASRDLEQTTLRGGMQQITVDHWKSTVNHHQLFIWWVYGGSMVCLVVLYGFVKNSESPDLRITGVIRDAG